MTRAESEKEKSNPKHAKYWDKVIAEREKKRREAEAAKQREEEATARAVVAVFELDAGSTSLDDATKNALTEYFAIRIAASPKFSVIPRSQIRELIDVQKLDSYNACYDESCQIELGKELAAEKSLAPKVLQTGDRCVVGAVLYDLRSEIAEKAASARTSCGEDALLDGIDNVVAELGGNIAGTVR